jgi:hypothetical protein
MAKKATKKATKKAAKKQTKTQTTLAVLTRARDLIVKGWTKNHLAANEAGAQVTFNSREACKFCAWGAVLRAEYDLGDIHSEATITLEETAGREIVNFNDKKRSSKPVIALFDKAIAKLEAKHA